MFCDAAGVCELLPEPVTATNSTQELLCVRLVGCPGERGLLAKLTPVHALFTEHQGGRGISEQHGWPLRLDFIKCLQRVGPCCGDAVPDTLRPSAMSQKPKFLKAVSTFLRFDSTMSPRKFRFEPREVRLIVGSCCAVARGVLPLSELGSRRGFEEWSAASNCLGNFRDQIWSYSVFCEAWGLWFVCSRQTAEMA